MKEITTLSAGEIARHIAAGDLSATEAVSAHIEKIEATHPALNALVVPLFDEARRDALAADEALARGDRVGPLHGVPVTIKEMFDVAGTPTTVGLTRRRTWRAKSDATVVRNLRQAGAVVLGKTNVPQMGMMLESDNPIYGRTNNPWNLERGPGGSSGGEAALVAAGGSPLGLGSDGGGSIRQPAHSCGIHGLKPTAARLSFQGHWSIPNFNAQWVQAGPLARHVDDLWLGLMAMHRGRESGEIDTPPTTLRDPADVDVSGLRVGMYLELDQRALAPAVSRAVEEAAAALRMRGATVGTFQPPDPEEAWRIYMGIFYADGMAVIKKEAAGSQLDWRSKQIIQFSRMPTLLRPLAGALLRICGQRAMAESFHHVKRRVLSVPRYLRLLQAQDAYRRRFAKAMREAGWDALICPPSPVPAVPHGEVFANWTILYTGLYNLLGLPAGVVAATRVRQGEQRERPPSRDVVDRAIARTDAGSDGLPVGVQVVADWWREDVVLAVMAELERQFREQAEYPDLSRASNVPVLSAV